MQAIRKYSVCRKLKNSSKTNEKLVSLLSLSTPPNLSANNCLHQRKIFSLPHSGQLMFGVRVPLQLPSHSSPCHPLWQKRGLRGERTMVWKVQCLGRIIISSHHHPFVKEEKSSQSQRSTFCLPGTPPPKAISIVGQLSGLLLVTKTEKKKHNWRKLAWCGIARQSAASSSLLPQIYQFLRDMVPIDQDVSTEWLNKGCNLARTVIAWGRGKWRGEAAGRQNCSHQLLGQSEDVARCSGVSSLSGALPPDHKDAHKTTVISS